MTLSAFTSESYGRRIEQARTGLLEDGAAALLVGVGADLRWLTGYDAKPLERLTMLVIARSPRPTLIVPRLEVAAAQLAPAVGAGLLEVQAWEETEDPVDLVAAAVADGVMTAGGPADDDTHPLLISDRLWASFLLRFQARMPRATFGLASRVLSPLRTVKSAEEVELLRRAAHAADRAVLAVAGGRLVGRSEADVAREVRARLVEEGHEAASFWIVGSGPNSASPHHDAGERVIQAGEPIVLDIGGTVEGYGSDMTRTLWVTGGDTTLGPDDAYRQLYAVLEEAQGAATRAVRPGVACEAIDATARELIASGGFGPNFIHRTGHGIGLEGHEEPYLVAGNAEPLREGHAFSVEPGIYLEDRYGARIEDIVVCGPDGPDVLNEAPRGLLVVSGL